MTGSRKVLAGAISVCLAVASLWILETTPLDGVPDACPTRGQQSRESNAWVAAQREGRPLAISHQGDRHPSDDVTLRGLEDVADLGFEFFETDLVLTRSRSGDLTLVASHAGFDPNPSGPTLHQLFTSTRLRDVNWNFELKYRGRRLDAAAKILGCALERYDAWDRVCLSWGVTYDPSPALDVLGDVCNCATLYQRLSDRVADADCVQVLHEARGGGLLDALDDEALLDAAPYGVILYQILPSFLSRDFTAEEYDDLLANPDVRGFITSRPESLRCAMVRSGDWPDRRLEAHTACNVAG